MGEIILVIVVIAGICLLGDVIGNIVNGVGDRAADAVADAAAKSGATGSPQDHGKGEPRGANERQGEKADD